MKMLNQNLSPILCGAIKCTKPAENKIKQTGSDTHAKY